MERVWDIVPAEHAVCGADTYVSGAPVFQTSSGWAVSVPAYGNAPFRPLAYTLPADARGHSRPAPRTGERINRVFALLARLMGRLRPGESFTGPAR